MPTCVREQLAASIVSHAVEAYRCCAANHEKCKLMLERMQMLQPSIEQLETALQKGAPTSNNLGASRCHALAGHLRLYICCM